MSRRDRLLVAGALLLGLFFIAQNAWQMDWALERFNAYYRPLDLAGAPPVAQGRVPKLFWDDDSYMHLALLREMHESGPCGNRTGPTWIMHRTAGSCTGAAFTCPGFAQSPGCALG